MRFSFINFLGGLELLAVGYNLGLEKQSLVDTEVGSSSQEDLSSIETKDVI